jgi:hypothetical protein
MILLHNPRKEREKKPKKRLNIHEKIDNALGIERYGSSSIRAYDWSGDPVSASKFWRLYKECSRYPKTPDVVLVDG